MVHRASVEQLGDRQSMQGPEISELELVVNSARVGGSEEELD